MVRFRPLLRPNLRLTGNEGGRVHCVAGLGSEDRCFFVLQSFGSFAFDPSSGRQAIVRQTLPPSRKCSLLFLVRQLLVQLGTPLESRLRSS